MGQVSVKYGSQISLRSHHGTYVVAEQNMMANRKTGEWKHFIITSAQGRPSGNEVHYGDAVYLRTAHGKFVCAEQNYTIVANRDVAAEWETFTILNPYAPFDKNVINVGNQVAFRTFHGRYLCAEQDGRLVGDRQKAREWERFVINANDATFRTTPHTHQSPQQTYVVDPYVTQQPYAPPSYQPYAPSAPYVPQPNVTNYQQPYAPPSHQPYAPPSHQPYAPPTHQSYAPSESYVPQPNVTTYQQPYAPPPSHQPYIPSEPYTPQPDVPSIYPQCTAPDVDQHWQGFWVQGDQRGDMDCLIKISNGQITGSGADNVGSFSWSGTFSYEGQVHLVKQYYGKHQVIYQGLLSGNTISGTWTIPNNGSGTFTLQKVGY